MIILWRLETPLSCLWSLFSFPDSSNGLVTHGNSIKEISFQSCYRTWLARLGINGKYLESMTWMDTNLVFRAIDRSNNSVSIATCFKYEIDASGRVWPPFPIKPAAPLLACVIRRVFFCPDYISLKGRGLE